VAPVEGMDVEFSQVIEVQRMEGIRLGLEVLAWAQGDRDSASYFEVSLAGPRSSSFIKH